MYPKIFTVFPSLLQCKAVRVSQQSVQGGKVQRGQGMLKKSVSELSPGLSRHRTNDQTSWLILFSSSWKIVDITSTQVWECKGTNALQRITELTGNDGVTALEIHDD